MSGPSDHRALLKAALTKIEKMERELKRSSAASREPIAIIGMACRYPGGIVNPEDYWTLLKEGRNGVVPVTDRRWQLGRFASCFPDPQSSRPFAGLVDGVEGFDAEFFGISPREADTLDPQQRMVLQVAWEALENSGIVAPDLKGSPSGVFMGVTTTDFARLAASQGPESMDAYTATGGAMNAVAGRLAYWLGLNGPCMAIDTACSSSLVALHLAENALKLKECNLAFAGGVNLILAPEPFVCFERWGMMAPDGQCKAFDDSANGFVRAEGCGILILKRLSDARKDGDTVLAVLRGSAVNQDGASAGLTVPNGLAQEQVLRQALASAGLAPRDIDYVEAHGTGTTLGDPIEYEAIDTVFSQPGRSRPLYVGSVKTNLGHAESAAGVAGVIKAILAMRHEQIPRQLHYSALSSRIRKSKAIEIAGTDVPWPRDERPRRAGVSSFGFSGTNAHVILEEAPASPSRPQLSIPIEHVLPLSARNPQDLELTVRRIHEHLSRNPQLNVEDVSYSASVGRSHFDCRTALVGRSVAELLVGLERSIEAGGEPEARVNPARPVFLFGGGSWLAPARELCLEATIFKREVMRCAEIAEFVSEFESLFSGQPTDPSGEVPRFGVFAASWGLAQTWREIGLAPGAILGHGAGEIVAAAQAGVLSLEDAIALWRSCERLRRQYGSGSLVATNASWNVIESFGDSAAGITAAAFNSAESLVLAGENEALNALRQQLAGAGYESWVLQETTLLAGALPESEIRSLRDFVSSLTFSTPSVPLYSTATGILLDTQNTDWADYWVGQIQAPVKLEQVVESLDSADHGPFIDMSPGGFLAPLVRLSLRSANRLVVAPGAKGDGPILGDIAARLYSAGQPIQWKSAWQTPSRRIWLPNYPFRETLHWPFDPADAPKTVAAGPVEKTSPMGRVVHPLLGAELKLSVSDRTVFQSTLAQDSHPELWEHRVLGQQLFPGSAFAEVGMACARTAAAADGATVQSLNILHPLRLSNSEPTVLQTVVSNPGSADALFEVFSRLPDSDAWTLHARGEFSRKSVDSGPVVPEGFSGSEVDTSAYMEKLADLGLDYGPTFCRLINASSLPGQVRATLQGQVESSGNNYLLHPGLLDAAFQLLGLAVAGDSEGSNEEPVYVPVSVGHFQVHAAPGERVEAEVSLRDSEAGATMLTGHIVLRNEDQSLLAVFRDICCMQASRDSIVGSHQHPVFHLSWVETENSLDLLDAGSTWTIFCADASLEERIRHSLAPTGGKVVFLGVDHLDNAGDQSWLNGPGRVLFICPDQSAGDPPEAAVRINLLLAHLARALDSSQSLTEALTVVTQRGLSVLDGDAVNPVHASLIGFARSVDAEMPSLDLSIVDLDDFGNDVVDVMMAEAGRQRQRPSQVAWRQGRRFLATLRPIRPMVIPQLFHLEAAKQGLLDSLRPVAGEAASPGPGQVTISLDVSGLNFRDVMSVLGMYPDATGPIGSECVGHITGLGDGVKGLALGDRVMAISDGAFCSEATAMGALAFPVPESLSDEEAATIPIAFLTAEYALNTVADMKPGDRVLIHAASGGVGLAAVQLAREAGAEIFATAGSEEKRAYLSTLGVTHVFDSRSLDFAEQIRSETVGEGIDIVLNSLAGEAISEGLCLLRSGGRFLEIGKTDLWTEERVAEVNADAAYHVIFLGELCQSDPERVGKLFAGLSDRFQSGRLHPLPLTSYSIDDAAGAFEFMARARHVGKVVVNHHRRGGLSVSDYASYLVTGGLGGLGFETARWLIDRGARNLVLVGRSDPDKSVREQLEELRDRADVVHVQGDIANPDIAGSALDTARRMGPIRGVVHAAGVIEDALLKDLSPELLKRVFRPKVGGAELLHEFTRDDGLEFFIMYAAGAGLFGSAGQAHYAAANAYLDGLAEMRRGAGLSALSIDWGPWARVGMASRLTSTDRWAQLGIRPLDPKQALDFMAAAALFGDGQVGIVNFEPGRMPRLDGDLAGASGHQQSTEVIENTVNELRQAYQTDGVYAIEVLVQNQAAAVLGVRDAKTLDFDAGLTELGLDSLMAVELSNRLADLLGVRLNSTFAFEFGSISAQAAELERLLGDLLVDSEPEQQQSTDELEDLLEEELRRAGY